MPVPIDVLRIEIDRRRRENRNRIAGGGAGRYGSRVILDYLDDHTGGGRIVPRDTRARLAALRVVRPPRSLIRGPCDGRCRFSFFD
jgi:predicted ThiF/HesA family dinucleotide-utilizing enzyme